MASILAFILMAGYLPTASAQDSQPNDQLSQAEQLAEEALAAESEAAAADEPPAPATGMPDINLLELARQGGPLMWPILLLSIVVVGFTVERLLGLRRRKIIPPALVRELGEQSKRSGGLDPRTAYKLCQEYPSTAAIVIQAVLLKVGRPHAEVEHTLQESTQREANRLYKNVRPIELSISVAPLLGLLGTVQGMIMAFYITAHAGASMNKGELLADGIYVALVTTFAGLSVAIPAAMIAHWFEGRIQTLIADVDDLLMGLLPQWERYEGKLRIRRKGSSEMEAQRLESPAAAEPADSPRQPANIAK